MWRCWAQLRSHFWNLSMNLINNYLLMKLLKLNNKKYKNYIIYNVFFFKINIYKSTRNRHQCHSILTILFEFFFLERDGLKIKIFKKWKKHSGYIINLHKFATNQNQIISISWDIGCNEWFFLIIILDQFCFFILIAAWKIKFKRIKKHLEILPA